MEKCFGVCHNWVQVSGDFDPRGSISKCYKNVSSYPPRRIAGTKWDNVSERIWSPVRYLLVGSISFFQLRSLPCSSDGKESVLDAGDLGLIPGSGRSSGEGNGYPLQYSCLENPSHGQRSLVGYSPWGCIKLDTTELLLLRTETWAQVPCPSNTSQIHNLSSWMSLTQTLLHSLSLQQSEAPW